MNRSTCNTCKKLVPATPTERQGQIFLVKSCPECGTSETLISGDAARYQAKRRLDSGFEHRGCTLKCLTCTHKQPNIVFVDITNRCNLNCPICINNTPTMGFLFEPPLDYFRRIFQHFSTYASPPSIQLFGGEPTVRADLFDIIRLAKSFGFANALREVEKRLARTARRGRDDRARRQAHVPREAPQASGHHRRRPRLPPPRQDRPSREGEGAGQGVGEGRPRFVTHGSAEPSPWALFRRPIRGWASR